MAGPQAWPDCDEDIKRFVERLAERLRTLLGPRLTGIYLHGSLAMGSYYRPKSDIDLIIVVDRPLDAGLAESVGIAVAQEAEGRPTVGAPELSVITAAAAKQVPVPTPFEVHYSTQWHDKIVNREVDYRVERTDLDLCAHLVYVVQRGICLYGDPIADVFGVVDWKHFMRAVMDDLDWILKGEHIVESPFYGILNICRVLQLLSEGGRSVYSKDEGGEWGLAHLPPPYRPAVRQALEVYRSFEEIPESMRKTGGKAWDKDMLLAFRDYARSVVSQLSKT